MLHKKNISIVILVSLAFILAACSGGAVVNANGVSSEPAVSEDGGLSSTATSYSAESASGTSYTIVDTGQTKCYDDKSEIACPAEGEAFYGQDAQYEGVQARYVDNGDGTVSDLNTGLMWQQDPGEKTTYAEAAANADSFELAGYTDWRLPTIKELYSLINFSGEDVSVSSPTGATPFIDTNYFNFEYGDTSTGERTIDSQWATSTLYTGTVMNGQTAMFGVNFADGRIKGYPANGGKTFFVIYVRGNTSYGVNDFVDNGDGTISDRATGLTWMQTNSGEGLNWEEALDYCESLDYSGYSDWRLPDAKELQSIVDYSRSPDVTGSAAIDPIFSISTITNEAGQVDYPAFWSSTTHVKAGGYGDAGVYIAFGQAMGNMHDTWMDVHGAGAQRSDAKSGDPSSFSTGRGPQGDAVRIYNYARCVRGGSSTTDVSYTPESAPAGESAPPSSSPSDGGGEESRPGDGRPDLEAAAEILGVTVEKLRAALGDPSDGPPDFEAAAEQLGVTVEELKEALGITEGETPPEGGPPPGGGGAPAQ
jgi:hypothetical protein